MRGEEFGAMGRLGMSERDGEQAAAAAAAAAGDETGSRMARLVRTIEGEIVPRLVMARRVLPTPIGADDAGRAPDDADVQEMVRLLLHHDVPFALALVESVRQQGADLESVCLKLLAPAARALGLLWQEDLCDFLQVTVGLCRLHQVLHELGPEFGADPATLKPDRRILLAAVPGEQHTFGISLVAQFLRKAGWEVWHEFPRGCDDIVKVLRQNSFTVVGLSVGSDALLEDVSAIVSGIRRKSRNREVAVLLGGPLLVERPEIAGLVGADATAVDCVQAVSRAERVCRARLLGR